MNERKEGKRYLWAGGDQHTQSHRLRAFGGRAGSRAVRRAPGGYGTGAALAARAPTFTHREAGATETDLVVPTEMVDPLAVSTGLEYQGTRHGNYLTAETAAGCIQFEAYRPHISAVELP